MTTPVLPNQQQEARDVLALNSDMAALRVTLPVIEGSGSYTTTISVSMLRRMFDALDAVLSPTAVPGAAFRGRSPCLILVDGSLGAGVLLLGTDYRVAEIREHWEPSPDKGVDPTISTVIRFDPLPAALATTTPAPADDLDVERLRDAVQACLVELSESPLPGARYAYEVVRRRFSAALSTTPPEAPKPPA